MAKTNIVLTGYMGTGKTSVGKALAKRLECKFIETDQMVVESAGKSIPEIFTESEIIFREHEIQACKKAASEQDAVISTGGGVVLNTINLLYLKETGHVVLLSATPETIIRRIMAAGKEKRPVIDKPDPLAEITKVLGFRSPFYEAATDLRVNTEGKSIETIVEEIIELVL